ncbi:MAG TPA: hypothetical protein PL151_10110 [Phycisphaerae bacterium]|nr:hypothetical protein [Phycisphaerae bacterium]
MMKYLTSSAAVVLFSTAAALGEWQTVDAMWRPDANPFAKKQVWQDFVWKEGWKHDEQFYPTHFHPAGSLHVILRNAATAAVRLQLTHVDGKPVGEVTTTAEKAGPVIYHWVEPEMVAAGGWTECIVRPRSLPRTDVRLTFQPDSGKPFDVTVPLSTRRVRAEGIAFSSGIDRVYIYLRALDSRDVPEVREVVLDGRMASNVRRIDGPFGSGLSLLEVPLSPAWETGSYHLVEISLAGGDRIVQPIRAWDHYFAIALFGSLSKEEAEEAKAHGINTYVAHSSLDVLHELGLNYIQVGSPGVGRPHTPEQSGRLYYYNMDEPDGHDALKIKTLPLLDRLGVHAMSAVIPIIRQQRTADPAALNLVLLNNTYKPANWYVYGQLGDLTATDPYVPISAEQLERVPCSLAVARDACAPHPLIAVIWATANSGHRWSTRPPTPQEERMMAYYAMGSGIAGLAYFADIGIEAEGGKFLALSDNAELWEEVGRINRDVSVLAPYLAIGCPLPNPLKHEQVWIRMLLCGPQAMVLVVVNKGHEIGFNTVTHHPFHFPAEDVEVSIDLPGHLQPCRIREVKDGELVEFSADFADGRASLKLGTVDTARAFVLTPTIAAE